MGYEAAVRIWIVRPDRARIERNVSKPLPATTLQLITNERVCFVGPDGRIEHYTDAGYSLSLPPATLDPLSIAGNVDLEVQGNVQVCGRDAFSVRVRAHASDTMQGLRPATSPLVDEQEWAVDTASGILLRSNRIVDGGVTGGFEFTSVRLDDPVDDSVFSEIDRTDAQ